MAALETKPCPATLWLLLKDDDIAVKLTGLASYSAEDVDYYDGAQHSLIVDANMLGNPHIQVNAEKAEQSVPALDIGVENIIAGTLYGVVANQPIQALATATTVTATNEGGASQVVLDGATTQKETTDDAFKVDSADLVPAPTKKTATLIKWWSEAAAAGNVVAMAWLHNLRYVGPEKPLRI